VLGPTGCGKTTLLNILAGLDGDYLGTIEFLPARPERSAYMFQKDLLLPWRTVLQNLVLGREAVGDDPPYDRARELLDTLDMARFADAYPSKLSVGMRQRVALGRTLLLGGDLILMDEPLSAQDFRTRLMLEEMLRGSLRRETTLAVVVTHNIDEAVVLGDRVLVLSGRPARVIEDFEVTDMPCENRPSEGRRSEMLASHVRRITRALIGAEPGERYA
jgi:NitT/TauT family transport system ATP-binding protein